MCYKRNRTHSCGTWISHTSFCAAKYFYCAALPCFEITWEIFSFFRHPNWQEIRQVFVRLFGDINISIKNCNFIILLDVLRYKSDKVFQDMTLVVPITCRYKISLVWHPNGIIQFLLICLFLRNNCCYNTDINLWSLKDTLEGIPLKNKTHLCNVRVYKFSSYRAVNTFPVGYKNLTVNYVRATNGSLLRGYCEIHVTYFVRMKSFANGEVRVVYTLV
jgi:hypothetical protein